MIESLEDYQPAIVVNTGDSVHVISVVTLRQLANGEKRTSLYGYFLGHWWT